MTQVTLSQVYLTVSLEYMLNSYAANVSASQYYVVGYKGTSPYDSGLFYCPYVPLQMVRAVGQNSFQPKIGFKTRYGMVQNPFATSGDGALDTSGAVVNSTKRILQTSKSYKHYKHYVILFFVRRQQNVINREFKRDYFFLI